MAHARGVDVMVDGAHAFAHFDFKIPDLGGDYYGASLHKWLGCPLGTGILYVRKDKIAALWPVYGDSAQFADTDIMKLNHTGTHPVARTSRSRTRSTFHNTIGTPAKGSAAALPAELLDEQGARHEERRAQHADRSRALVRHRQRRHRRA